MRSALLLRLDDLDVPIDDDVVRGGVRREGQAPESLHGAAPGGLAVERRRHGYVTRVTVAAEGHADLRLAPRTGGLPVIVGRRAAVGFHLTRGAVEDDLGLVLVVGDLDAGRF